jgi:hypothetical protein
MPIYFLLVDANLLEREIVPPLTAAWQQRSFAPCRPLCVALAPKASAFAEAFHTGTAEPFLGLANRPLPFDRHVWQLLVGEVLLVAASEIPEIQICPETLFRLLAPGPDLDATALPEERHPVQQAHYGSRFLSFGGKVYRPENAGYNDTEDVARLADYLSSIDPARWTSESLVQLTGAKDEADLQDELEFAREWFPALRDLYQRAKQRQQVVICELL